MTKIWHTSKSAKTAGGGVKTYVDGLMGAIPEAFSPEILTTLAPENQAQFDLLHLHDVRLLPEVSGDCPTIFTAHNHGAYCPSGTKYFATSQTGCDRPMNAFGCAWGHLVDGCGSRRPNNILSEWQQATAAATKLKQLQIPIIANSDFVRDRFLAEGFSPEQVTTLRYGITTPTTNCQPLTPEIVAAKRIFFAGRIVPEKGLDWLLKTLTKLDPAIQLDVAGEGWDLDRVKQVAVKLGVSDRVTWHGWCSGETLDALYQQSFAIIFPSLWHEPAGIITLESYARYRPIIASAVGGIPEHVRPNETGFLVPLNDVDRLAEAIATLAANPAQAKQFGEVGHTWFHEEFTLPIHIERLQPLYARAIEQYWASKQ